MTRTYSRETFHTFSNNFNWPLSLTSFFTVTKESFLLQKTSKTLFSCGWDFSSFGANKSWALSVNLVASQSASTISMLTSIFLRKYRILVLRRNVKVMRRRSEQYTNFWLLTDKVRISVTGGMGCPGCASQSQSPRSVQQQLRLTTLSKPEESLLDREVNFEKTCTIKTQRHWFWHPFVRFNLVVVEKKHQVLQFRHSFQIPKGGKYDYSNLTTSLSEILQKALQSSIWAYEY